MDRGLRAMRDETPEGAAAADAGAIWDRRLALEARRRRRVRRVAAACTACAALTGGTIAIAGVQTTLNAVRSIIWTLTFDNSSAPSRALVPSRITVEAVQGESSGVALRHGITPGEIRTGVLVGDPSWVNATRDGDGLTLNGLDQHGAVVGTVTISPDGKTISAVGDAFIIAGPTPRSPDVNHDGVVNLRDVEAILRQYGAECDCDADLDRDGRVGRADLAGALRAALEN
ncbi:MAG: hypothetical protein D6693_02730 [Planctomycetota bacterium]|nr:MAG: hypothetical protein D6693_02730 [Planctomycetota bacterium]